MQTVLITGTNRGIGLELVKQFLAKPYHVIATYRGKPSDILTELTQSENITLLELEVTSAESIKALVNKLDNQCIDILINNAGILGPENQSLENIDIEGWMQTFAVNSISPFVISQALLPLLEQSTAPKIINLSSMMAALHRESTGMYAYRSSKAALNKISQTMAVELKHKGFIICPVHPGWVKTDMGGEDAEITALESAQGIFKLAKNISIKDSGTFFTWQGDVHVW
ncbi:MAG: SDR family oxidoreductase [Saccharospirillaceae bacterium]|nr:SDR family oxidoreductase [Pseudomonadales bacterium]NRB81498.1 SDR family oxidoreductase [Saccharospirillaceae bacterium]